jgi:hypothetical protein
VTLQREKGSGFDRRNGFCIVLGKHRMRKGDNQYSQTFPLLYHKNSNLHSLFFAPVEVATSTVFSRLPQPVCNSD